MGKGIIFNVFVGGVPHLTTIEDLKHTFGRFGKVNAIFLKVNGKHNHGFVGFDTLRDAKRAVRRLNGYRFKFDNSPIRVEMTRLGSRGDGGIRIKRELVGAKRYGYRVVVNGLPKTTSIKDLQYHFWRAAGAYVFSATVGLNHATVEFVKTDYKFDIKSLDGKLFHSKKGETCRISVRPA